MGKYVYLYYAGKDSDAAGDDAAWGAWFGKLGDKLVDAGNPFDDGAKAVSKDGVMDVKDMPATGYSIVNADSMDAALEMTKDCPLLLAKDGAVCVYEALPM
jgi:hypothetical protein